MSDPVPDATTCCPLREAELALVGEIATALQRAGETGSELAAAIRAQKDNLDCLGSALARYPSPLEAQRLGDRSRSLDTLVHALSSAERVGFGLRAPTQSVVGRALSTAQINFFRLLWHACTHLQHDQSGPSLRERAARALRTSVYTHLVEEALTELATDGQQPQPLFGQCGRHLAGADLQRQRQGPQAAQQPEQLQGAVQRPQINVNPTQCQPQAGRHQRQPNRL
jgi:hypothetical protein